MSVRSLARRFGGFVLVPLALVACGDDAGGSKDTAADSAGGDSLAADSADAVAADGAGDGDTAAGDTAVEDTGSDAVGDTGSDAVGDTGSDAVGDAGGDVDSEVVEPVVNVASVSVDGVVTEVAANVRRGMVLTQSVQKSAFGTIGRANEMSCGGTGGIVEGGRIINPTSASISGGFGSNCDPGGTGANFRLGEEGMLYTARQTCGGRAGSCSVDLTDNFMQRFGQCAYGEVGFTVQYNCEALATGPGFIVEVPTSLGALRIEGLDGLGTMSCTERQAGFRLDSAPLNWDTEAACTVEITERSALTLKGRIEGTFTVGGASRRVVVDFESNETRIRAAAIAVFQDDLCASQSITASVRTVGDDTFDDFTTGTFACQANAARTLAPMTLSVPRPRVGGTAAVGVAQGDYRYASFDRLFEIDAAATRLRLSFYTLALCEDAGLQTCPVQVPILYFQTER